MSPSILAYTTYTNKHSTSTGSETFSQRSIKPDRQCPYWSFAQPTDTLVCSICSCPVRLVFDARNSRFFHLKGRMDDPKVGPRDVNTLASSSLEFDLITLEVGFVLDNFDESLWRAEGHTSCRQAIHTRIREYLGHLVLYVIFEAHV